MDTVRIDHYRAAGRGRPHVMADRAVWRATARLLARVEESTMDGSADAADSVVDDAETMLRHVALLSAETGHMDALRAAHTWFGTTGHAAEPDSATGRVPDWMTSSVSTATRKRSNSGRTVTTVTRHGRSWTVGNTRPTHRDECDAIRSADRVEHALIGIRRSSTGAMDGRELARITDVLYDVPALIGGDLTSWSEVLPDDVSARVHAGPYNYAAWIDDSAPVSAERKRTARRVTWPTRYRPAGMANGNDIRADERADHVEYRPCERSDGGSWFRVSLLPSVDGDTVAVGHGPRRPRTQTTRVARRSTRVKYAVIIPDAVPLADGLAGVAADAARGDRVAWRHGTVTGSLTLSNGGHYAARVTGAAWKVRTRTPIGLRDAVRIHTEH